jgi:uncharacterized protein with GYD domain
MRRFSLQISFTTPAWHALLDSPYDPLAAIRTPVESLGGKLEDAYFTEGTCDVLAITEFPDAISASELAVAFYAGGAVARIHASPLLTFLQAQEAVRNASSLSDRSSPRPRALAASAT